MKRNNDSTRNLYLDAAATVYPLKEVVECAFGFPWENPSSLNKFGADARGRIEDIRRRMQKFFGAEKKTLIFTSGGTESNNAAIFSALAFSENNARHPSEKSRGCGAHDSIGGIRHNSLFSGRIMLSGLDHASVYEAAHRFASDVIEIPVDRYGRIRLQEADFEGTDLVCLTHVNNEIGTITDVEAVFRRLSEIPAQRRPLLMIDGVQAPGKIPIDGIRNAIRMSDFYTLSAHKIHGMKGTGALICNKNFPICHHIGGAQEAGLRGGTENTSGIAAFGKAVELLANRGGEHSFSSARRAASLLLTMLKEKMGEQSYVLNSPPDGTPFILSLSLSGVKSEIMIHSLAEKGISVSSASACSSKKNTVSRVIRKIGTDADFADGTVRISFPPESFYSESEKPISEEELEFFVNSLCESAREIRKYNHKSSGKP